MGVTAPAPEQLVGWTPIAVAWTEEGPVVDWCYTEGEQFGDPFFGQTVERCLRRPFRLLFRHRTPMSTLAAVAAASDALPLAGLVFHCSRCGSTLVSQMLAQHPSLLVMAEPAPLHSVLAARWAHPEVSEEQARDWLRWTVAVLGRADRPQQRQLVVKLDAWAILHLRVIQEAYPEVPWIFLYRDPVEVLVSQLGHRGYHMVPGCLPSHLLGLAPGAPIGLAPEDYLSRVLVALFQAAAGSAGDRRSMLVNYRELPEAVLGRIAPWFGIEVRSHDVVGIVEVATRDAKNSCLPFAPDGELKRARATERLRASAERWVRPTYEVLETYRARAQEQQR